MTFREFKEKYQKIPVDEVSSFTPTNPVVTVLVQTYQQKDFIRECLDSILLQETNFEFEVLVGEDGSIDGTREICLEYAENYPEKIRLFLHHRENQIKVMGEATSNFNAFYNFYSAKGKYIAFCEGDDVWADPIKLQKQVDYLENNPGFVFTYHSFQAIDSEGSSLTNYEDNSQPKIDLSIKDILRVNYHPLLLCICFRNDVKEIPLEMIRVINIDTFLFSLLGQFGQAKFLDEIKPAKYRRHPGGIWGRRKKQKKYLSKIVTYQNLTEFYRREKNQDLVQYFNKRRKDSFKMLIFRMIKAGDLFSAYKETRRYLEIIFEKKN